MSKRNLYIIISFLIIVVCFLAFDNYNVRNILKENRVETSLKKQTNTYNNVAIMYETSYGSGEYIPTDDASWNTNDYKYNNALSRCENGSSISWDDTNKKVLVNTNVSDKCYVYFDAYLKPVINSATYTATGNTITVTVNATAGYGALSTYYYSIDNGSNWETSSSNVFTISNLNEETDYTVLIKVKDANNVESVNYNLSTRTIYNLVITSVSITGYPGGNIPTITEVVVNKNVEIKSYYMSMNNSSYKEIKLNYYTNFCYSSGNIPYKLYVVSVDGVQSEIYEGIFETCFIAGTKVWTEQGYKNIENIKYNDKVYTYNEETKKIELNKVNSVMIHNDTEIYELKIGNEIIKVTPLHRFYVKNRYENASWKAVKYLSTEDYVYNSFGVWEKIKEIKYYNENNVVYNLNVENNHNYFVTENNYLVHNMKEPC